MTAGLSEKLPLACDLTSLTDTERLRHRDLIRELSGLTSAVHEIRDGYELEFSSDASVCLKLAEFITLERLCCPFFIFGIEVEGKGQFRLRLSGPNGVKEFLRYTRLFTPP